MTAYRAFEDAQRTALRLAMSVSGCCRGSSDWAFGCLRRRELEPGTAGLAWSLSARRIAGWRCGRSALASSASDASRCSCSSRIALGLGLPVEPLGRVACHRCSSFVRGPHPPRLGVAAFRSFPPRRVDGTNDASIALGAVFSFGLALALGPGLQALVAEDVSRWAPRGDGAQETQNLIELSTGSGRPTGRPRLRQATPSPRSAARPVPMRTLTGSTSTWSPGAARNPRDVSGVRVGARRCRYVVGVLSRW